MTLKRGDIVESTDFYKGIAVVLNADGPDYVWCNWIFCANRDHYYGHRTDEGVPVGDITLSIDNVTKIGEINL